MAETNARIEAADALLKKITELVETSNHAHIKDLAEAYNLVVTAGNTDPTTQKRGPSRIM